MFAEIENIEKEGIKFCLARLDSRASRPSKIDNEERNDGERNGGEDAHDPAVHLREWDLVHLHLNRVAWRCLTLKMVSVYYLPTPIAPLSLSLVLSLFLTHSHSLLVFFFFFYHAPSLERRP